MTDERPKKSWRDIDARRDKSRSGGAPSSPTQSKLLEEQKSKQYRKALDALFEKGGFAKVAEALGRSDLVDEGADAAPPPAPSPAAAPAPPTPTVPSPEPESAATSKGKRRPEKSPTPSEERWALRKKVVEAVGRGEITKALDKYLARWPLPDDYEVLEQALEHNDDARIDEALGKLETLSAREKPRRARTLLGKLRYLEDTSRSSELRERALGVRKRLGG